MKTTSFLASAAKAAFALAAVVMMSAVFTSCSKDSDDDNLPEPKAQTVTLDDVEIKVEKSTLTNVGDNPHYYWLRLELEAGKEATTVLIALETSRHNGKQINLTEQKTKESDGWSVTVLKDTKWLCSGQEEKNDDYKFSSGTMKLNVDPTTKKAEVWLTGGEITTPSGLFGDGKKHTLAISYKGTAEK